MFFAPLRQSTHKSHHPLLWGMVGERVMGLNLISSREPETMLFCSQTAGVTVYDQFIQIMSSLKSAVTFVEM